MYNSTVYNFSVEHTVTRGPKIGKKLTVVNTTRNKNPSFEVFFIFSFI